MGEYCLYAGRLHDSKGVHVLLESLRKYPETRLLIVGDGPERARLEAMKEELKLLRVEFLGWQDREQVARYLRLCRFVVVPSVWHENFPYVITEAFAHGKAVIGSNRGGIPELVHDGQFGLVYDAGDSVELGACIDRLWNDPVLCAQMGRAAKEWCDHRFTDRACYEGLKDVYTEAIARGKERQERP